MRRCAVLQWSAKYFRNAQRPPSHVGRRPVESKPKQSNASTASAGTQGHRHSPGGSSTGQDLGAFQQHVNSAVTSPPRSSTPSRRAHNAPLEEDDAAGTSMAHRSAIEMVRKALTGIDRGIPSPRKIFEVKSEIVPALKLVLPDPIPRQGNMEELLHHEKNEAHGGGEGGSAQRGSSRFVAVPTSRIPQLAHASDADIAVFLAGTASLRGPTAQRHTLAMDDVADVLELAAQCGVFDANLILRLTSEVDRFVTHRAERSAAQYEQDSDAASTESTAAATDGGRSSSSLARTPVMSPNAIAKILFYVSQLGFLEEHVLTELLRYDVLKNLRTMDPRQLLHVAVALCRFHCTSEDVFEKVMKAIARQCEGTTLRETPTDATAAHSARTAVPPPSGGATTAGHAPPTPAGFTLTSVVPLSSFAHPSYAIPADTVVEFTKCVALSAHRTSGVVDSIAHRLLQLCEGKGGGNEQAGAAPRAEQLQFVCRLLRRMNLQCPPLDGALLVRAASEGNGAGVILDHSGDTEGEDRGTYNEFAADFVKM